MNPFTQLVTAKAMVLLAYFNQSKGIEHHATKGSLREAYIRNFLTEVIPQNSELIGGFITDAFGEMTPQIDLIGIEKSLPIIFLDQGTCVTPIESARFWIEIKSKLQTKHLSEIKERLDSIYNMTLHLLNRNTPISFKSEFNLPAFIVAYESDVQKETLKKWLIDNRFLCCIVVIGKYALWNIGDENTPVETIENEGNFEELLFLSAKIHQVYVLSSRVIESTRLQVNQLGLNPSLQDIEKYKKNTNNQLDMTHFSLQSYFESNKLIKDGTSLL